MRLARLQGGSGRESRARAGRSGQPTPSREASARGPFRAEPRGHRAAACARRAAAAWERGGLPVRIPRAKPPRAKGGKGSMEKFPYITEHGPINLPFAWDGKESGDFPRYVTEIIESSSRIKPRTPLFSPPPPHRGTISAVFPKSITEAPSHPGRGRETAARERPSGASAAEEGPPRGKTPAEGRRSAASGARFSTRHPKGTGSAPERPARMRLARLQGGSGRESRARAGRSGLGREGPGPAPPKRKP